MLSVNFKKFVVYTAFITIFSSIIFILNPEAALSITFPAIERNTINNTLPILPDAVKTTPTYIPPLGECNEGTYQEETDMNVNWSSWINKNPREMIPFLNHLRKIGETKEQINAISNKIAQLIPNLTKILSSSSFSKLRMGSNANGDMFWEIKFLNSQGNETADFVIGISSVEPDNPAVFWQGKKAKSTVKITDPETGELITDLEMTLVNDGSDNWIIKDRINNSKFTVKPDGTIIEDQEEEILPARPTKPTVGITDDSLTLETDIDAKNTTHAIIGIRPVGAGGIAEDVVEWKQEIELPQPGKTKTFDWGEVKVSENGKKLIIKVKADELESDQTYYAHVQAKNEYDASKWSEASEEFTIGAEEGELPAKPAKPTIKEHSVDKVKLSWSKAEGADYYRLVFQDLEGQIVHIEDNIEKPSIERKATELELEEGKSYQAKVVAVNEAGETEGELSDPFTIESTQEEGVEQWLEMLNDSDPNERADAAVKLEKLLIENPSHQLVSDIQNGLQKALPDILINEELSIDKKKKGIDNLIQSRPGLDVFTKVKEGADQTLLGKINTIVGKVLFDYLNNPEYEPPTGTEAIDPRDVCTNGLLKTEQGKEILKEIVKSDEELASGNLVKLLNKFLTSTIKPSIPLSQKRVDNITEVMLASDEGKAKIKESTTKYAEIGIDKRYEIKAILTSLDNNLGQQEGRKFIDSIKCSDVAMKLLNDVWKEIIGEEGQLPVNPETAPDISKSAAELDEELTVSWKKIERAKSYKVLAIDLEGNEIVIDKIDGKPIKDTSITIKPSDLGMKEGQIYSFQVKGVNEKGESKKWSPVSDTLEIRETGEDQLPAKPTKPTIEEHTPDKVRLVWDKVDNADSYKVAFQDLDGNIVHIEDNIEKLSIEKTAAELELEKGKSYQVKVVAVNQAGEIEGELSEPFKIESIEQLPANPTEAIEISKTSAGIDEEITISWNKIDRANSYKLLIADLEGNKQVVETIDNKPIESTSITITPAKLGLKNKTYTFQVKGVNETGESEKWSPISNTLKIKAEEVGPITPDKIYKEFGVRIEAGDMEAINLMYKAMRENYGLYKPGDFDPHSIMYSHSPDYLPQQDIEAIYKILKGMPEKFVDGLKGKTVKLFRDALACAKVEGGRTTSYVAGATNIEEPQLEENHVYMFISQKSDDRWNDSFESALYHELSHIIYNTGIANNGLSEKDREKLEENFWHGETDRQVVLSNIYDFADDRIKFYKNKPDGEEIIMEDWAYMAQSYFVNSLSLIEKAIYRTNQGLSTSITLPSGKKSSVIKEKMKFLAGLFKHNANGTEMTYIYKIKGNKIYRAEVSLNIDGLPNISGPINWKKM